MRPRTPGFVSTAPFWEAVGEGVMPGLEQGPRPRTDCRPSLSVGLPPSNLLWVHRSTPVGEAGSPKHSRGSCKPDAVGFPL